MPLRVKAGRATPCYRRQLRGMDRKYPHHSSASSGNRTLLVGVGTSQLCQQITSGTLLSSLRLDRIEDLAHHAVVVWRQLDNANEAKGQRATHQSRSGMTVAGKKRALSIYRRLHPDGLRS